MRVFTLNRDAQTRTFAPSLHLYIMSFSIINTFETRRYMIPHYIQESLCQCMYANYLIVRQFTNVCARSIIIISYRIALSCSYKTLFVIAAKRLIVCIIMCFFCAALSTVVYCCLFKKT